MFESDTSEKSLDRSNASLSLPSMLLSSPPLAAIIKRLTGGLCCFLFGWWWWWFAEGEAGRGASEGLTPVPSVAMCEDGDKSSQTALEDFSRWKPEGHWPSKGPKQRIALFAGVYNHVVDGVALTCNRLVAYLVSQGPFIREPRAGFRVMVGQGQGVALYDMRREASVPSAPRFASRRLLSCATVSPPQGFLLPLGGHA